jgi:PAS domain S-box-containing protein
MVSHPASARARAAYERAEIFRRIAHAATAGIVIIVDGRIIEANDAFGELFGYEAADVIGRTPLDLVVPESQGVVAMELAGTAEAERTYEARGRRRDGSTFDIEVTAKRIQYEGRPARGVVIRDISERKAMDRQKDEFVSMVSHELRTPLTSIRGSLGLMSGGAAGVLPAQALELVRVALQNTERLVRLVNDILDFEKIGSGALDLTITDVNPAEVVETVVTELRAVALQNEIAIATHIERHAPMAADRDRIIQVLTNLISNALKFSPAGTTVTVTADYGTAGAVRFTVADQGAGIPDEQRTRLFTPFVQLPSTTGRRYEGTGLGLAISRSIVERHGGRIGVDSAPGGGSTFWFELPPHGQ